MRHRIGSIAFGALQESRRHGRVEAYTVLGPYMGILRRRSDQADIHESCDAYADYGA